VQLLQQLLPGALQLQHEEQLVYPVPLLSLLLAAHVAQRLVLQQKQPEHQQQHEQQQDRVAVADDPAADEVFDALVLPMLLELLLLQPQDVKLARDVLALVGTAIKSKVRGGHHAGAFVLQVLLLRVGPQLLQLLNSSSSEPEVATQLQLAFGRLMVLLTDPSKA
jgi:hypothetical protein